MYVSVFQNDFYVSGGKCNDISSSFYRLTLPLTYNREKRIAPASRDANWTKLADMNIARAGHAMTSDGVHIYVCAGWNGLISVQSCEQLVNDKWLLIADMLQPARYNHRMLALNVGKLLLVGGVNEQHGVLRHIDIYDSVNNTWIRSHLILPEDVGEGLDITSVPTVPFAAYLN